MEIRPMSTRALAGFVAFVCLMNAGGASAQNAPGMAAPAWSALAQTFHLERGNTRRGWGHGLLDPLPRIGAFWTGGNPAGLAYEAGPAEGRIALRTARTDGEFRRPLDAPGINARGGDAVGVQPLGERGGLSGSISMVQVGNEPGARATMVAPYSSVPFVVTDSSTGTNRALHASLDGAGGWAIGNVALGLAAGYESLQGYSQRARIPRRHNLARPAATVGAEWHPQDAALAFGAFGRTFRTVETASIVNIRRGDPVVTRLNGYAPPTVIIVSSGGYFRRREADGVLGGVSATARFGGWKAVAHVERGALEERQFSQLASDPPTDTWNATATESGAAVQRTTGTLMTFELRSNHMSGDARLAASDSVIYRATESVTRAVIDVRRRANSDHAWGYLLAGEVVYENHDRGDTIQYAVRSQVESLEVSLRGGVAHQLNARVRIALEASHARYSPRGSIPPALHYPAAARELANGEAVFLATPHARSRGSVALEIDTGRAGRVRLDSFYESASPLMSEFTLAGAPSGDRATWGLALGFVLRD
jgi:hypothetical protein